MGQRANMYNLYCVKVRFKGRGLNVGRFLVLITKCHLISWEECKVNFESNFKEGDK